MKALLIIVFAVSGAFATTGDDYLTGSLRVGSTLRVDGTITGAAFTLGIDSSKIGALAVDSEKIAVGAVQKGHIAAGAVDTSRIALGGVDTGRLNWANPGNLDSGKILCIIGGNNSRFGVCNPATFTLNPAKCDCQ